MNRVRLDKIENNVVIESNTNKPMSIVVFS